MRFRVLPVLIVFAVMTLGVRVGEIWRDVGGIAIAQDDAAAGAEADMVPDPFDSPPTQVASADDLAAGGDTGTREPGATQTAARDPLSGMTVDPLQMTDEEIELLQRLAERRNALEERAEELKQREQVLQAAERRLDDKVAELESLKDTIEDLLLQYDEQQDEQVARLVNIYESMKPRDAAEIFEDLEMPVLLRVVDRMNERRTAPILAEMDPQKAQALTLELADRRDLPIPRE